MTEKAQNGEELSLRGARRRSNPGGEGKLQEGDYFAAPSLHSGLRLTAMTEGGSQEQK